MKISAAVFVSCFIGITPVLVMGTTISQWTFEASQPAAAGNYIAELGVSPGFASGSHAGAAAYSSPAGNGSSHSYSSTVWAVGDYWQFQVSTIGYQDIVLNWDQTSSSTGPGDFALNYSTDGSTFTLFTDYSVLANASPNPTWSSATAHWQYSFTNSLSSIADLNNAATVYFRLIDTASTNPTNGPVRTAGTDRIDNFTVSGTEISASVPDSIPSLAGLSCVLGLLEVLRRIRNDSSPWSQKHA